MLCPNCNQEIPDKSKYCIKCGQRIRQSTPRSQKDDSLDESYRLLSTIVTSTTGGSSTKEVIASLLKRGRLFLEDCDWKTANAYFDRVLDLNPESAHAYIGKLCAEQKVSTEDALADLSEPLDENSNYKKALRFADGAYKATITGYNQVILARIEAAQKEEIYLSAKHDLDIVRYGDESVDNSGMLRNTANEFQKISGYKDADELATECEAWAEKLEQEAEEIRQKIEQERIEQEKKDEITSKRNRKIALIVVPIFVVSLCVLGMLKTVVFPTLNYNKAVALFESGEFDAAIATFKELGDYKDAKEQITDIYRSQANQLMADGKFDLAGIKFLQAGEQNSARQCLGKSRIISSWGSHTVGLKSDGTVLAVGNNDFGECDVSNWRNIVAIAAGSSYTVGLKSDGTVLAVGYNGFGECDIGDWRDIVAISAGSSHTVGLKADGTVLAVGYNGDGQCDVGDWRDIVNIVAGDFYTVGLKADGTVLAVGNNRYGECDVDDWRDIVAISAGGFYTVGLKVDGTVIAAGDNYFGQCDVGDWRDIVDIVAMDYHTVGLKADGTVLAVGYNEDGQCDVGDWRDIVNIVAGGNHTVGLKADGTVIAVGDNDDGRCDVGDWRDIVAVFAGYSSTVGLKADGTVIAVGYSDDVYGWNLSSDISVTAPTKEDSTNQPNVLDNYLGAWTVDHTSIEYPTEVSLLIYKEDGNYYADCTYAVVPYFPSTIFGTLMLAESIPLSWDGSSISGHYNRDNWGATGELIISPSEDQLVVSITGEPTDEFFGNYTMGLNSAHFVRDTKTKEQKTALTYLGLTVAELSEVKDVEIINNVQMAEGARYITGKDIPLAFYLDRFDFDPLTGDERVIAVSVLENGYADDIFSGFLPPEYVENRIIDSGFDYTTSDEIYGDPGIAYDIDCGNYSITYVWEQGGTYPNYLMVRAK